MKRILVLLILFLASLAAIAQTQKGYVRSLGRPEKKGEPLDGVLVRVSGNHNTAKSDGNGIFYMNMPDKKNGDAYSLQQVQKNGYELNESELIGRQLAFSDKVTLTVVMVPKEQLQADKQRIENNAYQRAERDYHSKVGSFEKRMQRKELTVQQYRDSLADLQEKFERYQSLIDGLAEHYAHTDYDVLNEKDREINICIENGDLERADRLIRTLFDPIDVLKRNMESLARLDQLISEAGDVLAQSNEDWAALLKKQEKDAEYLYNLYTIALARYDHKKAGQYIETRALLDTANAKWQIDAALFFSKQNEFDKAETLYLRALDDYNRMLSHDRSPYLEADKVMTLNDLAQVYASTHRFAKCEPLLSEANALCEKLHKDDMATYYYTYVSAKAFTLNNLCNYYINTNRFNEAATWAVEGMLLYREASTKISLFSDRFLTASFLRILSSLATLSDFGNILSLVSDQVVGYVDVPELLALSRELTANMDEHLEECGVISQLLYTLSKFYQAPKYQSERETLLRNALDISRNLAKRNPQAYEPDLINYLNSLAEFLCETSRNQESEALYNESLELSRRLAKANPQVYRRHLLSTLSSVSVFYYYSGRLQESERVIREALEIEKELMKANPEQYGFQYANTLNDLAVVLKAGQKYDEAESLYLESLERIQHSTQGAADSLVYMTTKAEILYNLAGLYRDANRFQESLQRYEESLVINRALVAKGQGSEELQSNLIRSLCEVAALQVYFERLNEPKSLLAEALERAERLASDDAETYEPLLAFVLNDYANYNRITGNLKDSQKQFQKALKIYRKLAQRYPDVPMPQIVTCLSDCSLLCLERGQYKESKALLEEALGFCRHYEAIDPDTFFELHVNTALTLSEVYSNLKEFHNGYQLLVELVPSLKSLCQQYPEMWQERYLMVLGNLSYYALFERRYAESEQYALEVLTMDPSQQWVYSNLAPARLFLGRYAEAEEIYRAMKSEMQDSFLQDLKDLGAAGVVPKERQADVERIRMLLSE